VKWFDVTLNTPMRDIGWTWVVLLIGVAMIVRGAWWLWRNWPL
jgi:hypothetical protein